MLPFLGSWGLAPSREAQGGVTLAVAHQGLGTQCWPEEPNEHSGFVLVQGSGAWWAQILSKRSVSESASELMGGGGQLPRCWSEPAVHHRPHDRYT